MKRNSVVEKARMAAEKRTKELRKEFERSEKGVARSWEVVYAKDRK